MFGIHPLAFWIVVGVGGVLAVTPLIFLALQAAGRITPEMKGELWTRYRSWLVLAPLMMAPVVAGRLPAIVAVAVLGAMCYREFARAMGLFRHRAVSAVVALGGVAVTWAIAMRREELFQALLPLGMAAVLVGALLADQPKGYLQRVALGLLAFLLFGVCLGYFSALANHPLGVPIQLSILLCVELNDVFAFCSGKLLGRRPLAPRTSPKKTLGGALGALVLTSSLFAFLGGFIFAGTPLGAPVHLLALGMLLSVVGQAGDLVFSSIKRDLGLKDLGVVIPGHGGLLDRFDSLIFAGPAFFYYLRYFGGA